MNREDLRDPRLRRLLDYLHDIRDNLRDELVRIDVVPTVDALPDEAPPTRLFRVVADPNGMYVGNGNGRRLSRFTLTPI